jgi:predicted transcriptional regulator
VSGVYAFGENGSLLWSKAIIPNARGMNVVNNSTIFYRDGNGNIVVTNTGAAVGFAITAILYIFIRFIFVGAVARARSQINKNERRNAVYAYIAKNPGLTLYDISRGLQMNIGTVRYHLFILDLNHRILSFSETKFVRYFTNSNSYSQEDQALISLVRRDSYGKVLGYMVTRRDVSNMEITRELGIRESLVSRYIKDLTEKGIIIKDQSGFSSAYAIDDSQRERVAKAIRQVEGE